MKRTARLRAAALAAALAGLLVPVAGCDQPVAPPVTVREPLLDADDLGVFRGVLDGLRARSGGSFRVVDTTMAICEGPIEVVNPPPGGCMAQQSLDTVLRVLPAQSRVTAMLDFKTRNARRLPITGNLGDGVTRVSATFLDFGSTTDVVTLSAPAYPAPRLAVVLYRTQGDEGALRLVQQPDGQWVQEKSGLKDRPLRRAG